VLAFAALDLGWSKINRTCSRGVPACHAVEEIQHRVSGHRASMSKGISVVLLGFYGRIGKGGGGEGGLCSALICHRCAFVVYRRVHHLDDPIHSLFRRAHASARCVHLAASMLATWRAPYPCSCADGYRIRVHYFSDLSRRCVLRHCFLVGAGSMRAV